jgi:hypothetical protein
MIRTCILAAAVALTALGGCASVDGAGVNEIARPDAAPQRAATRFEAALSCMDEQFADYGVQGVSIAVSGVPDYTGRAFVGSDIWLQGAINRMSQRSRAFVVTDFNPNPYAPEQSLWSMLRENQRFYVPAYYIRGAISGFADQVATQNATAAVGGVRFDMGAGATQAFSVVSVDLSVAELAQRTMVGRAAAANEIVLQSRSAGAQLGGRLSTLGANLEMTFSRSEGVPQAVRALVELGAIEILGRLTGTPYWDCLGATHASPAAGQIRRDVFANMTPPERIVFAQRRLARLGFYRGAFDGVASPALTQAIAAYAAARGAPAYAADDARLYERLTLWRADQSAAALPAVAAAPAAPTVLPAPSAARPAQSVLRLDLFLSVAPTPGAPASMRLQSSRDAYAYCYLQDSEGAVMKVFPNRWQPDALVRPAAPLAVPAADAGFRLVAPPEGRQERIVCIASDRELGLSLAAPLKADLTPLSVRNVEEVVAAFRLEAQRQGAEMTVSTQALAARSR